jgi:hypothetical protein
MSITSTRKGQKQKRSKKNQNAFLKTRTSG